jgi:hypothetical protein
MEGQANFITSRQRDNERFSKTYRPDLGPTQTLLNGQWGSIPLDEAVEYNALCHNRFHWAVFFFTFGQRIPVLFLIQSEMSKLYGQTQLNLSFIGTYCCLSQDAYFSSYIEPFSGLYQEIIISHNCIQCLLVQAWRRLYVRAETCGLG